MERSAGDPGLPSRRLGDISRTDENITVLVDRCLPGLRVQIAEIAVNLKTDRIIELAFFDETRRSHQAGVVQRFVIDPEFEFPRAGPMVSSGYDQVLAIYIVGSPGRSAVGRNK